METSSSAYHGVVFTRRHSLGRGVHMRKLQMETTGVLVSSVIRLHFQAELPLR